MYVATVIARGDSLAKRNHAFDLRKLSNRTGDRYLDPMKIPLDKMPDWPGRMTAPVAAAYMGISHTTFLDRFRGTGVKEGGNVFWARVQLDRMIAEQFGLEATLGDVDAGLSDYDRWKAHL